ncbi:hypothetical protein MYAM1_001448 [Malassezia yamatoensis]|uniref:Mitochondrial carrier protein n=1 Tax=Malassezia yamatoensis TaxID=253288 RepID=A0AAJ5YRV9_9BASI|nr:hypothetical protein MYAM1_001448 [Malassezia yamatoensis]
MVARREGKKLGVPYLRRLVRQEKVSDEGNLTLKPILLLSLVAPPLLANVAIGFTLFETYTLTQDILLHKRHAEQSNERRGKFTPTYIVAIAGSVAGAAQCIISAPLDNVRLVLQRLLVKDVSNQATLPAIVTRPIQTWRTILQAAMLPFLPHTLYQRLIHHMNVRIVSHEPKTETRFQHLPNHLRLLSRRVHGISLILSLIRDSAGFGCFFVSFEYARRMAFHASLAIDNVVRILRHDGPGAFAGKPAGSDPEEDYNLDFSYNASRTVYGRITAALLLVCGGGIGALLYELVSRPIEYMRMVLWYGLHVSQRRRSRAASALKTPSKSKVPPHRQASIAYTVRPVRTMFPVPRVSHTQSVRRLRSLRRRVPLASVLKGNSKLAITQVDPSQASGPSNRTERSVRAMRARANARHRRYSQSTVMKLIKYARMTAPPGSRLGTLPLLFQTFFIRPFTYPELCKASAPRPWGAAPSALPPAPTSLLKALRPEKSTIGSRFWHVAQRIGPNTGKIAAPFGYMLNRVGIKH